MTQTRPDGREHMTLKRMDNVLIVVDDLEAVKAFFLELGLELEGEVTVEGASVDRLVGLQNVRATECASSQASSRACSLMAQSWSGK